MADHPLRPATHRRLGRLLPPQLANRPHPRPSAPACSQRPAFLLGMTPGAYAVFNPLSRDYPPPSVRSGTWSSPVCHATCAPKGPFASDLHVLSTPPAFVLSQDQTLHLLTVFLALSSPHDPPEPSTLRSCPKPAWLLHQRTVYLCPYKGPLSNIKHFLFLSSNLQALRNLFCISSRFSTEALLIKASFLPSFYKRSRHNNPS